jgi:hypothetical protein
MRVGEALALRWSVSGPLTSATFASLDQRGDPIGAVQIRPTWWRGLQLATLPGGSVTLQMPVLSGHLQNLGATGESLVDCLVAEAGVYAPEGAIDADAVFAIYADLTEAAASSEAELLFAVRELRTHPAAAVGPAKR